MRVAIIDLGTNSVRFDVHEFQSNREYRILHREKLMIRLGQGVFLGGKLDRNAVRRALSSFARFKRIAGEMKVDRIIAFGTSALRDAEDSEAFIELVLAKTGIGLRVISGAEEAKLISLGVLSNEEESGLFALVDIGGGSTEISICRGKKVIRSHSFPLGTARLQQLFLREIPPGGKALEDLRFHIRTVLKERIDEEKWPKVEKIVGSSGTIRALARMIRKTVGKPAIERKSLSDLMKRLSRMSHQQIARVPGIEPKRVDMIVAGGVLFEECMAALGAKKARQTEYSLRDGILEEELSLFKRKESSHLSLHYSDFYEIARRCGADRKQVLANEKLASDLFERLRPVHRLAPKWKIYLTAAAILKDVGKVITLTHFEAHSFYMIRHMDFPAAEAWEQDFIARLCFCQKAAKPPIKAVTRPYDRKTKDAFQRLVAMLSIIDTVVADSVSGAALLDARVSKSRIAVFLKKKRVSGLEAVGLEGKRELFEKTFNRQVTVEFG